MHVPAPALLSVPIGQYRRIRPYANRVKNDDITRNTTLHEWIKGYDKTYENGTRSVKNGTISADARTCSRTIQTTDTQYGKI